MKLEVQFRQEEELLCMKEGKSSPDILRVDKQCKAVPSFSIQVLMLP